jgi:hypothetical protein
MRCRRHRRFGLPLSPTERHCLDNIRRRYDSHCSTSSRLPCGTCCINTPRVNTQPMFQIGIGLRIRIVAALAVGFSLSCVGIHADQLSAGAYAELSSRVAILQNSFWVYLDADQGLNHGVPSGWFGSSASIIQSLGVNAAYVDGPVGLLDRVHGTLLAVSFPAESASEYVGLNTEDPENWGANGQPSSNGYNLSGAPWPWPCSHRPRLAKLTPNCFA